MPPDDLTGSRTAAIADASDGSFVARVPREPFQVHLVNFTGPFDLLLGLIAKHKLDITEVALAEVTDEFIAAVRAAEAGDVEDAEDLEMLEARDLLFARLLQYRAYKEVARGIAERLELQARSLPRTVALEPQLAALLPELVLQIGPSELAILAAHALAPRQAPAGVDLTHLHAPAVSVREQAAVLVDRLRRSGSSSFRALVHDAETTLVIVVRFLALLELFREGVVAFDQVSPLGDLTVRWTGTDDVEVDVTDDYGGAPGADPLGALPDEPPPDLGTVGPSPDGPTAPESPDEHEEGRR